MFDLKLLTEHQRVVRYREFSGIQGRSIQKLEPETDAYQNSQRRSRRTSILRFDLLSIHNSGLHPTREGIWACRLHRASM